MAHLASATSSAIPVKSMCNWELEFLKFLVLLLASVPQTVQSSFRLRVSAL